MGQRSDRLCLRRQLLPEAPPLLAPPQALAAAPPALGHPALVAVVTAGWLRPHLWRAWGLLLLLLLVLLPLPVLALLLLLLCLLPWAPVFLKQTGWQGASNTHEVCAMFAKELPAFK